MDNKEAMELRMMVVLRGSSDIDSADMRRELENCVMRTGREFGAEVVEVAFTALPSEDELMYEAQADWIAD